MDYFEAGYCSENGDTAKVPIGRTILGTLLETFQALPKLYRSMGASAIYQLTSR